MAVPREAPAMRSLLLASLLCALPLLATACGEPDEPKDTSEADADTDSDTDGDTDADADTDADTDTNPNPTISVPGGVDCGTVDYGDSTTCDFFIENVGGATLVIDSFHWESSDWLFSVQDLSRDQIPAGENAQVTILFEGTSCCGSMFDVLFIENNDPVFDTVQVEIDGDVNP